MKSQDKNNSVSDKYDEILSKQELRQLIQSIDDVKNEISKLKNHGVSWQEVNQYIQVYEMYQYPLLFAWEKMGFGAHWDFWEEGHSMLEYLMFESKIKEVIPQLIQILTIQSPFAHSTFDSDGSLTQRLLEVYRALDKGFQT